MADHLLEEAAGGAEDSKESLRFAESNSQVQSCVRERSWAPLFSAVGFRRRDLLQDSFTRRVLAPAHAGGYCCATATALLSLFFFGSVSYAVFLAGVDGRQSPTASSASTGRPEEDVIQLSLKTKQCENYTSHWHCTNEALHRGHESKKKVVRECCADYILPKMLKFDRHPGSFKAKFGRCALMGSSSLLKGANKGREIDQHNTVIRINRLPNPEFQDDFGTRASIIFMAATNQMLGKVPLMRDGFLVDCDSLDNCKDAGMVFLQRRGEDCPIEWLKGVWHLEHHRYIGCVSNETKDLGYSLSTRTYDDGFVHLSGIMSSGFVAMLTFAPLCEELDMYGFGGRDTADGHVEWDGHPLEMEHLVERQLARGRWWDIKVDGLSQVFFDEWKKHVNKISMK